MIYSLSALRFVEKALLVAALLLFMRAFSPLFASYGPTGMLVEGIVTIGVLALVGLLMLARADRFLYVFFLDKLLIIIVAFVVLSLIWSVAPLATATSLPIFLGATALGVYLASQYETNEQLRLFGVTFAIAAVMSMLFGLFLDIGIMRDSSNAGSWQGILEHKNELGRIMVLTVIVFWLKTPRTKVSWILIALAGVLLLLSQSVTSIVTSVTLIMIVPLFRVLQWRTTSAMPVILAVGLLILAIIALLTISNLASLTALVGKDLTLTGRTLLWGDVWQKIAERPLLGYGYNAFWLGLEGESAEIWAKYGWRPNHAHNGFLDLWLELGIVGVLLLLVHLTKTGLRALRLATSNRSLIALWPLVLTAVLLLFSVNYSVLISQSLFFWSVYTCVALTLIRNERLMARDSRSNSQGDAMIGYLEHQP